MALTKNQILALDDSEITEVEVPEWRGSVYIRVMDAAAREQLEIQSRKISNNGDTASHYRELVCVLSICDKDGNLLFDRKDIEILGKRNSKAIDRIFEASFKHSKIGQDEVDALVGESNPVTN